MIKSNSKSKNEIISELYESEFMDSLLRKITSNNSLKEDLKQEVFLIISEMDSSKIEQLYVDNHLKYYVIRIIKNQYHSSTSPFHYKYRNNNKIDHNIDLSMEDSYEVQSVYGDQLERYIQERDSSDVYSKEVRETLNRIMSIIDNDLHWYSRDILKMYFKIGKWDKIDGEFRDLTCDKDKSTYRRMEEITKIDHTSLYLTVKEGLDIIKNKLKDI